jgi:YbgC/YbaW family acyl-CoA thioester hydrolase
MYRAERRINFYECDPAGIMFFSRIFDLCHSALEEWLDNEGMVMDYFRSSHYAYPILHSEADFFKPLIVGDNIAVELSVNRLQESSFELIYLLKNSSDERLAAVKTVHVCISKGDWHKETLPDLLRIILENHLS